MQTEKPDTPSLVALIDVPASLGLLTRLPIRVNVEDASRRGPHSSWAYPIAGAAVAVMSGCAAFLALAIGLTPSIAAALLLAVQTIVTGAMHEDGLADSLDGLWGGWTTERRLEIMKDSHIGVYGVLGLILSMILRWSAVTMILSADHLWGAAIAVAMISRAALPCLMSALPNARVAGLSHHVGRPLPVTALIAVALAYLVAILLVGPAAAFLSVCAAAFVTIGWAAIARRKIGGQTGDILGAAQQLTEIACLLVLALLVSS